ncbi:BMP family ABC transporter substrate-binding protein [Rossellomorea marisflavi]|uniref:BMP family lipoprotein n=1 Tax=Rossellomorea marisflavi TaxID=189381 RepID=UPI00345B0378
MKKIIMILLTLVVMSGCSAVTKSTSSPEPYSVGILLSDSGLGDDSFNDLAFNGLERARDELGIIFDYAEAPDGNMEGALEELINQKHDLIIGLGFSAQESLEVEAKKHPKQAFLLIDATSDLENVTSVTFKEHEGSFLVGMVAAMTSKTGTVSFIGGEDAPVIHKFQSGFEQGARYAKSDINILTGYTNSFNDLNAGERLAGDQIKKKSDFIYAAAGMSGIGSLKTAQAKGVLSAGVDADQFFIAEKSVATSMMKNVDIAIYNFIDNTLNEKKQTPSSYELGLSENGVGLAQIRIVNLKPDQMKKLDEAKEKIISGDIDVEAP